MSYYNRLANATNPYQGNMRRVLCVCSAGLLRSPTIAWILSNPPFNFNTRAAGISKEYALIPVDDALLVWADDIICVEERISEQVRNELEDIAVKPVYTIETPDRYMTRSPELIEYLTPKLKELYNFENPST
jgi:predicted protein tyrosine phosphatase